MTLRSRPPGDSNVDQVRPPGFVDSVSVTGQPFHEGQATPSDAAEHITEARQRARQVLGAEAHLGDVDDWRQMLVSARDALILVWLTWVALQGFGQPAFAGHMLVAMAIGIALLVGISTARSTHTQVQYYEAELERERTEIREAFDEERDEVRVLYAAKGFRDPLLGQIVDTLSADDDRLLKVMMEEELGLSLHHIHHPLIVGAWNFAGAAVAGIALALPVRWMQPEMGMKWILAGGAALLGVVSLVASRATGRRTLEFFTTAVVMAVVTGGAVYFLAQWLAGLAAIPKTA